MLMWQLVQEIWTTYINCMICYTEYRPLRSWLLPLVNHAHLYLFGTLTDDMGITGFKENDYLYISGTQ